VSPDLQFTCTGARADRYAAGPTLVLDLGIAEAAGVRVHALVLRVQIRVEPARRSYSDAEAARMLDLFGERPRWGDTLKPLQLATIPLAVPGFVGETTIELPVPCTYDMELAPTRYLHALGEGEAPLLLLFSGTVFYVGAGGVQVEQVPWDREVRFRLPAATWREMMDRYFPGQTWLRLGTETADELATYKNRQALPTFDDALRRLLAHAGERVP
jgi:hypothetical protein